MLRDYFAVGPGEYGSAATKVRTTAESGERSKGRAAQTISCSTDWRLLVPLWRTDSLYHELKHSHQSYEAVHDWWRDRYKVAADHLGIRPKARGIGWHRLRANVAALIEWLRIAHRQDWLKSARHKRRSHQADNQVAPGCEVTRSHKKAGEAIANKLTRYRKRWGITAAYGEAAQVLGLKERIPPSRRPRGAPAGQEQFPIR